MLPLQAAGTAGASVAINPIKAIGAMKSRHFVIAAASLDVFGLNFLPARPLLAEQLSVWAKHSRHQSRQHRSTWRRTAFSHRSMSLKVDQFYCDNDRRRKKSYDASNAMNGITAAVLLSSLLVACAQTQPPEATAPPAPSSAPAPAAVPGPTQAPAAESAPADHIVNIQRARCGDLLRLAPDDRAAATMFYIGYQASRFRARTINVALIPSIEAQALTYCEENPDRPVVQAFAEAYSEARR
jgi:hypothetical protein